MARGWGILVAGLCSVAQAAPLGAKVLADESVASTWKAPPPWLARVVSQSPESGWLPPLGRFGLPWEEPFYRRVDVIRWSVRGSALTLGTVGSLQTDREGTFFAGERLFSLCDVPGIRFRPSFIENWDVGAGVLVGISKNFTPSNAWGVMMVGRRL